jgi:hypothetical protein
MPGTDGPDGFTAAAFRLSLLACGGDHDLEASETISLLGAIAVVRAAGLFRQHVPHSSDPEHPIDGGNMPDEMVLALLVNVASFTLLYLVLLWARIGLAKAVDNHTDEMATAGSAVKPPRVNEVHDV